MSGHVITVACGFCGWRGELLHRAAEVQLLVALDVGHDMATLAIAVEHILCPRCDRTRLQLADCHVGPVAAEPPF